MRPVYLVYAQVTNQSTSVVPRNSADAAQSASVACCCTPSFNPCCTRNGPARVSSVSTTISAKPTSNGRR